MWLQTKEAKNRMDIYFGRIQALSQSEKLESRVRFALQVWKQLLPASLPSLSWRFWLSATTVTLPTAAMHQGTLLHPWLRFYPC
jgi:hypothetical protein